MKYFGLFLLCFLTVLFVYEVFIVSGAKRNYKLKKNKYPAEVMLLVNMFKLDLEKINYNQLLQLVTVVSSLDIALIVTLGSLLKTYLQQMLLCLIIVVPVILLSYYLVSLFYKKKGMIKNV